MAMRIARLRLFFYSEVKSIASLASKKPHVILSYQIHSSVSLCGQPPRQSADTPRPRAADVTGP